MYVIALSDLILEDMNIFIFHFDIQFHFFFYLSVFTYQRFLIKN